MGERYKGWISQPPLSVHSSVGKYLVLAYMPCDPKGGCLLHSTTRLNLPIESSVNKHLILAYIPRDPKGGCFVSWYYKFKHYKGDEIGIQMILDNGVH